MDGTSEHFDFQVGDHVHVTTDDWSLIGPDLVLVNAEPVPGSSQCIVVSDGVERVVSRFDLRHA